MEYVIPLSADPQIFTIPLAGVEYQITLKWNDQAESGWFIDLDLPDNAGSIVHGIPLVTGCDLLRPYAHLGIGGGLYIYSDANDLAPTEDNLGNGVDLIFVTEDVAA